MLKKIIKNIVGSFGYQLSKTSNKPTHKTTQIMFTMQAALQRCKKRGLDVATVIDVGASDGRWSEDCIKVLPNANYLLVEAQQGHKEGLEAFKKKHANGDYILAAAGATAGELFFDTSDLFGGLASETPFEKNGIRVPVVALDDQVAEKDLKPPYLLKLDTHGFELPILEGASEILKNAELVIIETYNFRLTENSLKYYEMCDYMEQLGFSPVENVDLLLREHDKAFWQMDTFFIPSSNEVFSRNTFR
jgi:FkbM family methyltransferase